MKQDDVISETDRRWELQMKLKRKSKVFLHSHDDVTSFEMIALYDLFESENVESLISMRQTYTTDDARQLTVKQRKCIFQDEVNLKYYQNDIYSLSVCMIKCRMQKALKLCNCIPPFYAPVGENWLAKSCNSTLDSFSCLARYRKNITSMNGCSHCDLSCFTTIYETEKFTLRWVCLCVCNAQLTEKSVKIIYTLLCLFFVENSVAANVPVALTLSLSHCYSHLACLTYNLTCHDVAFRTKPNRKTMESLQHLKMRKTSFSSQWSFSPGL